MRQRARRPTVALRWLAPTVVAVSLVPDVAMLFTDMEANTSGLGVAALMVMHLTTATVAVLTFARVLPLPPTR